MSDTLTGLDIRPLSEALGAEIRGVDLSQPLDGATVAAIDLLCGQLRQRVLGNAA